jgi:GNAT superfamily N-acetyltransferase
LRNLLALGLAFHAEARSVFPPLDLAKVHAELATSVDAGLAFGWRSDGQLTGALLLHVGNAWFTRAPALFDMMFYVLPEARRSRAAVSLVAAAKACARSRRLPLNIAVSAGSDLTRKNEFMRRQGFTALGGIYCWRP